MNIHIDPILIDRLVDGELDENERRDVLRRLETSPDGWRRCALAFLENQAFAQSASEWSPASSPVPSVQRKTIVGATNSRSVHRSYPGIAWAATLLACVFLAGFSIGGTQSGDARSIVAFPTAMVRPQPTVQPIPTNLGAMPPRLMTTSGVALAPTEPAPVSDYVRSQWERVGFQIHQKRKYVTMDLDDGRRVTLPIDDVEVQYVGRPTY